MYRGFNLNIDTNNLIESKTFLKLFDDGQDYNNIGKRLLETNKREVETNLNSFLNPNKSLNGSEIQENWFPQVEADIFLSHSHTDKNLATYLAAWFKVNFHLNVFIDSTVWGYSDNLLKIIDEKFCSKSEGIFKYKERNYSTSHVHLMLATALNNMINKCECIIFLNTPNSISVKETIEMTQSPWIYSELAFSKTIQKIIPNRIRHNQQIYLEKGLSINESKNWIEYQLDLSHLNEIDLNTLVTLKSNKGKKNNDVLDELYFNISPLKDSLSKTINS